MSGEFKDLLEPIELLEPMGIHAEFNPLLLNTVTRCNYGFVCNTGEMEL